jgi:hypothetical protein
MSKTNDDGTIYIDNAPGKWRPGGRIPPFVFSELFREVGDALPEEDGFISEGNCKASMNLREDSLIRCLWSPSHGECPSVAEIASHSASPSSLSDVPSISRHPNHLNCDRCDAVKVFLQKRNSDPPDFWASSFVAAISVSPHFGARQDAPRSQEMESTRNLAALGIRVRIESSNLRAYLRVESWNTTQPIQHIDAWILGAKSSRIRLTLRDDGGSLLIAKSALSRPAAAWAREAGLLFVLLRPVETGFIEQIQAQLRLLQTVSTNEAVSNVLEPAIALSTNDPGKGHPTWSAWSSCLRVRLYQLT